MVPVVAGVVVLALLALLYLLRPGRTALEGNFWRVFLFCFPRPPQVFPARIRSSRSRA
jgi:hypothetical protein